MLHPKAAASIIVPTPLLTVNAAIVLPLGVIVPVPAAIIDRLVYVPPVAKIKLLAMFTVDTAGIHVLPVKSRLLIQLAVVIVGIDAPDISERLIAVEVDPPAVVPTVNVLVTPIVLLKPPVPVGLKLVRVAILNTV